MQQELDSDFMSEVDRRLKLHCEVSFVWDDPLLETSRKFGLISHGLLTNTMGDIGLEHIVSSQIADTTEGHNMLNLMKAQESSGFWIIEEMIPEKYVKEFIIKVTSIRSVIVDSIQLKSGRVHMNFRFHETDLKAISDLLLSAISSNGSTVLEFLGRSKGIFHDLIKIARDIDIVSVDIKMTGVEKIFDGSVPKAPWIRVRRSFAFGDDEVHYIFYNKSTGEVKHEKMHVISMEDSLYEFNISSNLIKFVNSKVAEGRIIRFAIADYFDGNALKTRFIIPRALVQSYLGILSLASNNFPETKMAITGIRDLKDIAGEPI